MKAFNKSVASWMKVKVPLYSGVQEIKQKEKEIKELLDLNFGKDWRFAVSIYYWEPISRHHIGYLNPNKFEEHKSIFWKKRKTYWYLSLRILLDYLRFGLETTKEKILNDEYRMYWVENPNDYLQLKTKTGKQKSELNLQPFITSKIFEKVESEKSQESQEIYNDSFFQDYWNVCHPTETQEAKIEEQQIEEVEMPVKEKQDAEYFADKLNETDELFESLNNKNAEGTINMGELMRLKELKKQRREWQHKYDELTRTR